MGRRTIARPGVVEAYGDSNVFFDVDDIPMGDDFRDVIQTRSRTSTSCSRYQIGLGLEPRAARNRHGLRARRLLEALRLQKRVIPVLIGDTPMPTVAVLPSDLGEVPAYLNVVRLRPDPDF